MSSPAAPAALALLGGCGAGCGMGAAPLRCLARSFAAFISRSLALASSRLPAFFSAMASALSVLTNARTSAGSGSSPALLPPAAASLPGCHASTPISNTFCSSILRWLARPGLSVISMPSVASW